MHTSQTNLRKLTLVPAAVALLGALVVSTAAQARGVDVQVTITPPVVRLPVPVITVPGRVVVQPAPVHYSQPPVVSYEPRYHHHGYNAPSRWDADGDGIPNRHDRVYNPRWDRNGNGVPDRREFHRYHPHGDRDRDGIPNRYDRHDDRYRHHGYYGHDGRWHDGRRDGHPDSHPDARRDGRSDGRHPHSEWRGPR